MPAPLRAASRRFRGWLSSWRLWFVEPHLNLRDWLHSFDRALVRRRAHLDVLRLESRFMPAICLEAKEDFGAPDDTNINYDKLAYCYFTEGEASDYSAVINWGDGDYSTPGKIIEGGGTPPFGKKSFTVEGGWHDYDAVKDHTITVSVSGPESDSDTVTVHVTEGQYLSIDGGTHYEENGYAFIPVEVKNGSNTPATDFTRTIKVYYETIEVDEEPGIYPATEQVDYPRTTGWLHFKPGDSSNYIILPIDDETYDSWSGELFRVLLSQPSQADFTSWTSTTEPRNAFITIADDEEPLAYFSQSIYRALDSATNAEITVNLKYVSDIDLKVSFRTYEDQFFHEDEVLATPNTDSTHDPWEDYDAVNPGDFTITAGSMQGTFLVRLRDDETDIDEDLEIVGLEILPQSGTTNEDKRPLAQPWTTDDHDLADLEILERTSTDYWQSLFSLILESIDPYLLQNGLPVPCSCGCSCSNPSDSGLLFLPGIGGSLLPVSFISCATDGLSCGRYQTASVGGVILFDPLTIVYSTETANAAPTGSARVSLGKGSAVPGKVKVELTFNGNTGDPVTISLAGLSDTVDAAISLRAPVAIDKADVYDWSMSVTALFDDDSGEGVEFGLDNQRKAVVRNPSSSPYGTGWNFSSLDRIYDYDNDYILYATGDGWGYIFDEASGGAYTGPDDFFGSLVKNKDDTYTLTLLDQTKKNFRTDGQLATVTDRHNLTITYSYDKSDQLVNIFDPDGRIATFTYDAGWLRTLEQAGNRVATFSADAAGVHSVQLPDGGTRTFTYDATHHLLVSEKWGTRTTTLNYESAVVTSIDQGLGTVTKIRTAVFPGESRAMDGSRPMAIITDPLHYATTVALDDVGRLLTLYTPDGAVQKWSLNAAGLPITYTDQLDRTTTFTYVSSTDRLSGVTRPDKSTLQYEYDSTYYQLKRFEDSLGRVTTFGLNATGDVTTITNALSEVTTIKWDAKRPGLVESVTDPLNHTTTYSYDGNRRLETITDADNFVTTMGYDAAWNLQTVTDPLNRVTTYAYDKMRRLTAVTTPDKATTSYAYAAPGWRTLTTDPLGRDTVESYDVRGWRIAVTEADGKTLERTTTVTYDPAGRVIHITDPLGQVESYRYDPVGRLINFTDVMGHATTQSFDDAGRLLTVEDPLEHTTTYAYDDNRDWLKTITDPLSRVTSFGYDTEGQLTKVTDATGVATSYVYDKLGRVTRVLEANELRTGTYLYDAAGNVSLTVDHFGTTTAYDYNARNLLTKITEAYGTGTYDRYTQFDYDKAGQLLFSTDPFGTVTSYGYDAGGRVSSVIEAKGLALSRTTQFGYDAAGRQTSITDALGTVTSFAYDDLDRLTKITEDANGGLARNTTFAYDLLNRLTGSTDPMGTRSVYFYDELSRLTLQVDGLTGDLAATPPLASAYHYDAVGHVILAIAPGGAVTSTAYNAVGMPTKVTEAYGDKVAEASTLFTYDKLDRVIGITDPRNTVTSFSYDGLSRVTKVVEAVGVSGVERTTTYVYGTTANTVQVTNPRGYYGTISFDPLGRLASQSDGLGHARTFSYDDLDRLVTSADALGRTTTYSYDVLSRVSRVDAPEGAFVTFLYDAMDRQTYATDALNHTTSFGYDALGRMTRRADAEGGVTTLNYDLNDNLVTMIDPVDNKTSYAYDGLNRLTKMTDPLGHSATYAYNAAGLLASESKRDSRRLDYVYDKLNRLINEKWYSPGAGLVETVTFAYDKAGNQTLAANAAGMYTLTYDALNHVDHVDGLWDTALTFTYDLAGNRTKAEDNFGGVATSVYDAANRLTKREFDSSSLDPVRIDFAYTEANELKTITRYADLAGKSLKGTTHFEYDNAGRTKLIDHKNSSNSSFLTLTYMYDVVNRVTTIVRDAATVTFAYDKTDQLSFDGTTATSYGYDDNGNRDDFSYGKANRITYGGDTAFDIDGAGNLVEEVYDGGNKRTYVYDHHNRLVHFENALRVEVYEGEEIVGYVYPTVIDEEFTYDAWGNLVGQRIRLYDLDENSEPELVADAHERFAVDGWATRQDFWGREPAYVGLENFDVWADLTTADELVVRRVYGVGVDALAARVDSDIVTFYGTDRLGSAVAFTDGTSGATSEVSFSAWGAQLTGDLVDRYGWVGREHDAAGHVYMRARWYRVDIGRFITEDPIADDFTNLYRYVGNSPTNATDPSGLQIVSSPSPPIPPTTIAQAMAGPWTLLPPPEFCPSNTSLDSTILGSDLCKPDLCSVDTNGDLDLRLLFVPRCGFGPIVKFDGKDVYAIVPPPPMKWVYFKGTWSRQPINWEPPTPLWGPESSFGYTLMALPFAMSGMRLGSLIGLPSRTAPRPAQVTLNQQAGRTFQQRVTTAAGATPNTTRMAGTTSAGTPYTTIPDGIMPNGALLECKAGQYVSYTPQIQAQISIGQAAGGPGNVLVVGPTTTVSGPTISAFGHSATNPTIFRFNPATGTFTPY